MASVSVVYYSGYGHTAVQAASVAEGARAIPKVDVALVQTTDLLATSDKEPWERLARSTAIIFGSPTYMGGPAAPMKAFMDASAKVWLKHEWKDKLASGFTCSGSQSGDKLATLISLAIFAAQHGMVWVSLGLAPGNNSSAGSVNDLNRLGSWLGAMSQANVDQDAASGMPSSDLKTAFYLGQRVANMALTWAL
jgi:multimeric flavodoxin WrbA